MGQGRRARVLATLLALASLFTVAGAHEGDLGDQLERTNSQLEQAKDELADLEAASDVARSDLDAADQRVVAALADLRRVEQDLADAEAELEQARAQTSAATEQLLAVTDRLERAQQELTTWKRRRDDRVAAAYKYGRTAYLDAFMGARDFTELVTTGYYVRSVLDSDRRIVDEVDHLVTTISQERAEADRLRDVARANEQQALTAQQRVATLREQQAHAAADARREQARRAEIMRQLDSQAEATEALIADLEAESQRLAEELARSRWRAGAPGKGELIWPTDGTAGSGFGWRTHPIAGTRRMHTGVDIGAPTGQAIYAAAEGLVVSSGWRGGYGQAVVIDHGGGLATLYAHQSRLVVREGEVVTQGQKIGEVGTTGYSTGPHLHFEVRVNGEPRDPMDWY